MRIVPLIENATVKADRANIHLLSCIGHGAASRNWAIFLLYRSKLKVLLGCIAICGFFCSFVGVPPTLTLPHRTGGGDFNSLPPLCGGGVGGGGHQQEGKLRAIV